MDVWNVLGIKRTDDKSAIRAAYAEALKTRHPETNPEGFKELRAAYEKALKGEPEPREDNFLLGKIKEVYFDFPRRIDVDAWRGILDLDICSQIDTEKQALDTFLEFFAYNYKIPKYIWELIIDFFAIDERKEELTKTHHPEFIEYVLRWKTSEDFIRYDKFKLNPQKSWEDYEEFLRVCQKINSAMAESPAPFKTIAKLFNDLNDLEIFNLDAEIMRRRYYLTADPARAAALTERLYAEFPDDPKVLFIESQNKMNAEKYDEALELLGKF